MGLGLVLSLPLLLCVALVVREYSRNCGGMEKTPLTLLGWLVLFGEGKAAARVCSVLEHPWWILEACVFLATEVLQSFGDFLTLMSCLVADEQRNGSSIEL